MIKNLHFHVKKQKRSRLLEDFWVSARAQNLSNLGFSWLFTVGRLVDVELFPSLIALVDGLGWTQRPDSD